jgi:aminomuconate-semialdehyde/2-hydroxymuconate-6-semialdehyde dehydrogenase
MPIGFIAKAEAKDQGKTLKRAISIEIPRAVKNLRYFAGAVLNYEGQASAMEGFQSFTLICPIGIVGLISPWNLPLYLLTWKLAPALASINNSL